MAFSPYNFLFSVRVEFSEKFMEDKANTSCPINPSVVFEHQRVGLTDFPESSESSDPSLNRIISMFKLKPHTPKHGYSTETIVADRCVLIARRDRTVKTVLEYVFGVVREPTVGFSQIHLAETLRAAGMRL